MRSPDDGLRRLFRAHLRRVHWTTIETGLAQRGVPDLAGCAEGVEFWVECKSVRRGWAIKFQPGQISWLLAHARHGGRSWIAVRRRTDKASRISTKTAGQSRSESCDDLYLAPGHCVRDLVDRGLPAVLPSPLVLLRTSGGPERWDWDAVRATLLGR